MNFLYFKDGNTIRVISIPHITSILVTKDAVTINTDDGRETYCQNTEHRQNRTNALAALIEAGFALE